jgi:metallo-beta-lactamase class B
MPTRLRSPGLGPGLVLAFALAGDLGAQAREEWRAWNQPVDPFRIFGPLYYLGASDIAAYAIATSEGLIVLDGGFPETAPLIEKNLATLGFRIGDVKILLNSHAHFDHAGGLAELAAKSGALVVASEGDAAQLEAGGKGDFAWGDDATFPPVTVGRRVRDRETVTLGGVTLTAQITAGHTRGCTSWTARFEQAGVARDAVFVCSVSVPDPASYRLADNPRYPEIARDYEASFRRLRELPCDLFLGAHGAFFDLAGKTKRRAMGMGMRDPFVDPEGYRTYVDRAEAAFRAALAQARSSSGAAPAAGSPPPTTSTNSPGSDGRRASAAAISDSRP